MRLLARPCRPADSHRRRIGGAAASDQLACDLGEVRQSHEDDQRLGVSDLIPVDRGDGVSGDKRDGRGMLAVGQRHAGVCRDAERHGDAGDDFERDAGIGECLRFFTTASEQERIAALEPDHREAAARALDQHGADLVLREGVLGLLLADVDALCSAGARASNSCGARWSYRTAPADCRHAAAFDRDQLGIAGA